MQGEEPMIKIVDRVCEKALLYVSARGMVQFSAYPNGKSHITEAMLQDFQARNGCCSVLQGWPWQQLVLLTELHSDQTGQQGNASSLTAFKCWWMRHNRVSGQRCFVSEKQSGRWRRIWPKLWLNLTCLCSFLFACWSCTSDFCLRQSNGAFQKWRRGRLHTRRLSWGLWTSWPFTILLQM